MSEENELLLFNPQKATLGIRT